MDADRFRSPLTVRRRKLRVFTVQPCRALREGPGTLLAPAPGQGHVSCCPGGEPHVGEQAERPSPFQAPLGCRKLPAGKGTLRRRWLGPQLAARGQSERRASQGALPTQGFRHH